MKHFSLIAVLLSSMLFAVPALAADPQMKADSAVADILFEYEGSETFATYTVSDEGFVEITFARNIPDALYSEILQKLRSNGDISGVLAGTTGPSCNTF